MSETAPHVPVLLNEVLQCFEAMPPEGTFVDCTLGYGGHSEAMLRKFPRIRLIGIDQDPEALDFSRKRLAPFGERVEFRKGRFSQVLPQILQERGDVCGVLADFGVSSLQLDKMERGFSFHSETLDMRMDPSAPFSAYDVVNEYPQQELERIFRDYAEERRWRQAARAVAEARARGPIESGKELAELLARVLPKKGKTHPATALFQAIRIEVNDELGEIERLLEALEANPPKGAVVGLITFHSLEDRLVKRRFAQWARSCICPPESFRCTCGNDHALGRPLGRKPRTASPEEVKANPRSRSAKLRCFQFKE